MVKLNMITFKHANAALQRLFVYGSLKSGQASHPVLADKSNGLAKYWCKATTTIKMPLVVGTRYNIPFLINKPGVGNYVTGEIYEVDDQMMDVLDNLEDSKRLFKREVQQMNMGIEQGNVLCNVYLLDKYPEYLLDLPYISEYYNTAKQPYIRKTLRKKTLAEDDFTSSSAASV